MWDLAKDLHRNFVNYVWMPIAVIAECITIYWLIELKWIDNNIQLLTWEDALPIVLTSVFWILVGLGVTKLIEKQIEKKKIQCSIRKKIDTIKNYKIEYKMIIVSSIRNSTDILKVTHENKECIIKMQADGLGAVIENDIDEQQRFRFDDLIWTHLTSLNDTEKQAILSWTEANQALDENQHRKEAENQRRQQEFSSLFGRSGDPNAWMGR